MVTFVSLAWLIPVLPLVGALAMLLVRSRTLATWLCPGAVLGSFALSVGAALEVRGASAEVVIAPWLERFGADWALLIDPLSSVMLLVVTGVSFLIHLYSTAYMKHDPGYARFFGYLNLFVFFMLVLVMANNYLMLFVGWEGVGAASYLLIGFWFDRKPATDAAMKAFLTNRVGDAAFVLGVMTLFAATGSVRFADVFAKVDESTAAIAALLLFFGACGKSAQFPLHTWLPDAMEGPTPVSALIHAATMVTAGVYLIARSAPLFDLTPETQMIVAATGALTAILGASLAMVQHDIKRVLAYSTISQLGYMVLALGCGAYWVAIFHLVTHAFFKALLFLGAGSVIHAVGGEQDMRATGGLRKHIPVTFWTMLIGGLALAGVPGLGGFFSKDEILRVSLATSDVLFGVGIVTALMTAFYMGRLLVITFFGEYRGPGHPHESPRSMTVPLVVLAVLSVVSGALAGPLRSMLSPGEGATQAWGVMAAASAVAFAGLAIAWRVHELPGPVARFLDRKWFIDDVYDAVFVRGLGKGAGAVLAAFDRTIVDGAVNNAGAGTRLAARISIWWDEWIVDGAVRLTGWLTIAASGPARRLQSGQLHTYAAAVVTGVILALGYFWMESAG